MNYYQEPELIRDCKEEYYVRSHILSRIIIILLIVSTAIILVLMTPVYAQDSNQEEDNISLNFSEFKNAGAMPGVQLTSPTT